jgi:hypothetical protein
VRSAFERPNIPDNIEVFASLNRAKSDSVAKQTQSGYIRE